jgi:hypothetical protein
MESGSVANQPAESIDRSAIPLGKPLPRDLILRLVDYRVGEVTRKKSK